MSLFDVIYMVYLKNRMKVIIIFLFLSICRFHYHDNAVKYN